MDRAKNIRERCHVNTDRDGDTFVGVKANTDDAVICFPIGYQLPDNDDDLRVDIHNLFGVLAVFLKEDRSIDVPKNETPRTVDFPLHAYLRVIRSFLQTGRYYVEVEPQYKTDSKGNASWARTVREQRPLIQKNGSLIFTQMTVRSATPNANKKITQIHKMCVYEAFDKLGWLYVPFLPEQAEQHPPIQECIFILNKKLVTSHNEKELELFGAMRDMLIYMDEKGDDRQYYFGTDHFEVVWEKMIDRAFGIADKSLYFPKTRWLLDYGRIKEKTPLFPDTIMIYGDKLYVLDAKYYRYGQSGDPDDLPNGASINKQITYGEYIERILNLPNERLFNAFLMPYNRSNNLFQLSGNIENIGEAVGDWRGNMKYYERIQGIVVDTRFLMFNFIGAPEQQKKELAECIERVMHRASIPSPTS